MKKIIKDRWFFYIVFESNRKKFGKHLESIEESIDQILFQ